MMRNVVDAHQQEYFLRMTVGDRLDAVGNALNHIGNDSTVLYPKVIAKHLVPTAAIGEAVANKHNVGIGYRHHLEQ